MILCFVEIADLARDLLLFHYPLVCTDGQLSWRFILCLISFDILGGDQAKAFIGGF